MPSLTIYPPPDGPDPARQVGRPEGFRRLMAAAGPFPMTSEFARLFLRSIGEQDGIRQARWLDQIAGMLDDHTDDEIRRMMRVRNGTSAAGQLARIVAAVRRLAAARPAE